MTSTVSSILMICFFLREREGNNSWDITSCCLGLGWRLTLQGRVEAEEGNQITVNHLTQYFIF